MADRASSQYVACPACRQMGFDVIQDVRSGEILIECRSCKAPLLRSAPPESLPGQASGGQALAPSGGPWRV